MADDGTPQPDARAAMRLDKWLWHARVTRTRTLARKLVEAGKVRLNRARVRSASQAVRIGDVLTIVLPRAVLVYEVADFADRRGPYSQASLLYVDRSPPPQDVPAEPGRQSAPPVHKRPEGRERLKARRMAGKPG